MNILNYPNWKNSFIINESKSTKKLILFSGPSASGKSTLAHKIGAKSWHLSSKSDMVLVGTDDFNNDNNFKKFQSILKSVGLKELSKFSDDWHWLIETYYKKDFIKWKESADTSELNLYNEIKKEVGFSKSKTTANGRSDGRVCGMAWIAHLYPAKTIIFDDIDVAIKNYFQVKDILLFTPLNIFINNIKSRNKSRDTSSKISVNDDGTALYQYCKWYKASNEPDLENKKYLKKDILKELSEAGHKNPNEIIKLLGADTMNEFYLKTRSGVNPDMIVNTREKSSGRAVDIDKLKL